MFHHKSLVIGGLVLSMFLLSILSCKTAKTAYSNDDFKEEFLDTLYIDGSDSSFWSTEEENTIEFSPYNPSATRFFDLIHTRIRVAFDWTKQYVNGSADLIIKPLFYPQAHLVLDAKNFEIKNIHFSNMEEPLKYSYDGSHLDVDLGKTFLKDETIEITVDYIAKPEEGESSGSIAITSDKGLFFINPLNTEPEKPMQIWTQGETENNSKWFPTFDNPNERSTEEIFVTVEDKFSTLSNGLHVSSTKNVDGTRTDYWKQDKPHAPYLFMLAVGEFAWVNDTWNGIPLYYIVEKKYAPFAKQIFNHTPEMLSFFSEKLNYKYPWDKFAQIIVRDYVSGAMENTTAVVFGEFIQKTDRELIDNENDLIVAHEMFHHWFGDLVTCESWANLTLNEGFANYAEYLWTEHKYGKEKADQHRVEEEQGYLQSVGAVDMHPLIHYHYADKENMFDAHSYNKGGLVLHYLRNYVGDDAFFASLNKYLIDNAFSSVEIDELRMAFEDVTGEDLHWFFDQWYLDKGHVDITADYTYDANKHTLNVVTKQASKSVFKTYFDAAVVDPSGTVSYHRLWTTKEQDTLKIANVSEQPLCISLDGKGIVPGFVSENKKDSEWAAQFKYIPALECRLDAFNNLVDGSPLKNSLLEQALNEPLPLYQQLAIESIPEEYLELYSSKLTDLAKGGKHSSIRLAAINRLASSQYASISDLAKYQIENDKVFDVINNALTLLSNIDPDTALKEAELLQNNDSEQLLIGLATVFASSPDPKYLSWFHKKLATASIYQSFDLISLYATYILNSEPENIVENVDPLKDIALNHKENIFKKFFATATIFSIKSQLENLSKESGNSSFSIFTNKLGEIIKSIKSQETDKMLIDKYSEF